jgi:hypothetical protein
MADMLGYAASCAVLASFLMRAMVPLRLIAILSKVLFLAFGYIQNIHPIFFLHMVLLPINVWRLLVLQRAASMQSLPGFNAFAVPIASRTYSFWIVTGLVAGLASLLAFVIVARLPHI